MTPEKIGRYEIKQEIGRGGMATVFEAYDPHFERTVAVKVLPKQFLHEEEFRARFVREAKTVAGLDHPAIVPVYDFGEDGDQPYLVMRLMTGGSLADRLKDGPLPVEESAAILMRIGAALDQAHSQGIIHRDLKPSNILFDQYGEAFLADFGIVHISSSTAALTASGSMVGTPAYMSPEQVYGDKELDGRSDVYALGVILFQMLTGGTPYSAETPARLMMKHVMDPVPLVIEKMPDLAPGYDKVISKAMAKDRDKRYATASDLSTDLENTSRNQPIPELQTEPTAEIEETFISPEPPAQELAPETAAAEPQLARPQTDEPLLEPASGVYDVAPGRQGTKIPGWVWAVAAAIVVICIAAAAGAAWLVRNDKLAFLQPTAITAATIEPTAAATLEPTKAIDTAAATDAAAGRLVTATAFAQNQLTKTAEQAEVVAQETAAAEQTRLAVGVPDVEATRASVIAARETVAAQSAAATAAAKPADPSSLPALYGPENGILAHELDGFIETAVTGVNVRDFVLRVRAANPFGVDQGSWDMGVIFRQADLDQELRLVIRSDELWNLNDRQGDDDNFIAEESLQGVLDLDPNGSNEIMLVVVDDDGYFFLNGQFIAPLDLSSRGTSGDVAFGTGFYTVSEQAGEASRYQGLTVWPMTAQFGPVSDQLDHIDDGLIKTKEAGVELSNFLAEAVLENPYDANQNGWDIGFAFRSAGVGEQFWLIVDSEQLWALYDRQAGEDETIADGGIDNLETGGGDSNSLRLIAISGTGYLFINDSFVTVLDLSSRLEPGDVELVTTFYVGNEIEGETTRYQDFTVWPLP